VRVGVMSGLRGGWTLRNNQMSHDEQFITHIVFNKTI
jgi:hypothetical protein